MQLLLLRLADLLSGCYGIAVDPQPAQQVCSYRIVHAQGLPS